MQKGKTQVLQVEMNRPLEASEIARKRSFVEGCRLFAIIMLSHSGMMLRLQILNMMIDL